MFRKPGAKRAQQGRQRKDESSSGDDAESEVVREGLAKRRRKNPMMQSTKKEDEEAKKKKTASSDSSSSDEGTAAPMYAYAASGTAGSLVPKDMGATATLDIDTEKGADAQSQFERIQKLLEEQEQQEEADGKKLYRGQAMYGAKKAKDTAKGNASSGMNRVGPVRAPQFLRQTVRWDYAPDICKDYKETGFCTFGDSCKFMHDRSDYKHGWELERDWEEAQKKGGHDEDTNYEIHSDEDELPEECAICHLPFKYPVVTRCKHYFCESCAIEAFKKSKKCKVCQQNTAGVFNIAKEIIEKQSGGTSKKRMKEEEEEESSDGEVKVEPKEEIMEEEAVEEGGEGEKEEEQEKGDIEIENEVDDDEEQDIENESDEDEEEETEVKKEPEEHS